MNIPVLSCLDGYGYICENYDLSLNNFEINNKVFEFFNKLKS